MINSIPQSWNYNNSLEMLFLFYQRAEELLSESTPDTYSLPLHNSLTLMYEIEEVFDLLSQYGMLDVYYQKYIPPIIEEFISNIESDYILKRMLGKRLPSIRTGFEEAEKEYTHLKGWINIVRQICSFAKYRKEYQAEIERIVIDTPDKTKLQYCMVNYFICLVRCGYSREYLYMMTKKFFDNKYKDINQAVQITEYFTLFPCTKQEQEFLVLMDTDSIDYLGSVSGDPIFGENIKKIDIETERDSLCKDPAVKRLFSEYDKKTAEAKAHSSVSVVRFHDNELDPYKAATQFSDSIGFLQTFTRYFKHYNYTKEVYRFLHKGSNGYYVEIKIPQKMLKRPYVQQETIDKRIKNILFAKSMAPEAFESLTNAIEMHSEAFDSRSTPTLLRTFWTALETLFSDPNPNSTRDNVIHSVLPIIQKTYILKVMRVLYIQLCSATDMHDLEVLNISDFTSFLQYFSAYKEDSPEMKAIYSLLSKNPLLRSRLFSARKKLTSGKCIAQYLDDHKKKINWQLMRLYRLRNIATHLGKQIAGTDVAVNHLHNYFDFVVNYMLCKSENGDPIISITSLVLEAKNDNRIYEEMLKSDAQLSESNYQELLFGPDPNLIKYEFEC